MKFEPVGRQGQERGPDVLDDVHRVEPGSEVRVQFAADSGPQERTVSPRDLGHGGRIAGPQAGQEAVEVGLAVHGNPGAVESAKSPSHTCVRNKL